jgi:hypothetical protein
MPLTVDMVTVVGILFITVFHFQVVFVKREDAEMAVKKYNNRELDGQPMQVGSRPVFHGVSMDSLEYRLGSPCPTTLRPVGGCP